MTCSILIAVAASNIRAKPSPWILASDASLQWEAGVQAWVGPDLARELELGRHSLMKPLWNRLLRPLEARSRAAGTLDPEQELPEDRVRTHPLWSMLAKSLQFQVPGRRPAPSGTHINILEVRAGLRAEKQQQSRRSPRTRFNLAMDSQVALGAIGKGRSSSRAINRELQRSLPYHLSYDSYLDLMYFPTAENPADDGTRNVTLRSPSEEPPSWFAAAQTGNFAPLDDWLSTLDSTPEAALDLPPLEEIVVVGRPLLSRKEARLAWRTSGRARRQKPEGHDTAPKLSCGTQTLSKEIQLLFADIPLRQFVTCDGKLPDLSARGFLDLYSERFLWGGARSGQADQPVGLDLRIEPRCLRGPPGSDRPAKDLAAG